MAAVPRRAAYWPTKPRPGETASAGAGVWRRIAGLVDRRPRRVWSLSLIGLLACAAFAPTLNSKGVPLDEVFVNDAPSVAAQKTLSAALVFEHLFGFTGTDASVPLYGFVFLVALGVDYNIFLMSRVREESHRHGVRRGVLLGLTSTGGVITSLLVPALVRDAGPRIWWPSSLSRHPDPSDPPDPPR
ncbi:MMPL family protein [Actinomadura madurae]|uniref:MMPL family protein n=1 Tax=Actinomadura madurae TaxID=1993 RepID=A0A1I5L540_9ACTN|nr:MMPL family transporter [Actinomadura madurae]SFO92328.1 MMPL family protein [Actinomadura madurae]